MITVISVVIVTHKRHSELHGNFVKEIEKYLEEKNNIKDSFAAHVTSESYDSGNISNECSKSSYNINLEYF